MKTRRTTRSFASNSRHVEEKASQELLPFDLVVEILMKLPAKSIARFRCLSKVCASTLISPHFTNSFLTISWSRPNLLITCQKDGETFFFSSPQPQNPLSPVTSASFHMRFPVNCPAQVSRPVCGLVCGLDQRTLNKRIVTVPLICNPSTGQSLTLPRLKTRRKQVISYLGYDPIDKQFKVLCMTQTAAGPGTFLSGEHQVLTLEAAGKKLSWRMIKCDIPHTADNADYIFRDDRSIYDGICINGVVYYLAFISWGEPGGFPDIVCFDIRSEKFSFIKKSLQDTKRNCGGPKATLVNYKGKLAKLQPNRANQIYISIDLWVLEDAQKHKWSSYIYVLPLPLRSIFEKTSLCIVGTTGTGEIVLSPKNISDSFYLLYYNPETNTITRVEIQGVEAFKAHRAYIFLDHVENVKLMASV